MQHQLIRTNMGTTVDYIPSFNLKPYFGNSTRHFGPASQPAIKESQDRSPEFSAALAHELRNPLTTIKLSVEMLGSLISDEKLTVFLAMISRGAERIDELARELLANRNSRAKIEKYSIHQLLDELLTMAADRLQLKNIQVIRNYTHDISIAMNKSEVRIALTNIIVNAIEAMNYGGKLKIATRAIDGRLMILIQDNGCGISATNLAKIFDPNFTNKPGGLGVGLTATADLLRTNHISVNVDSKEGKGTRFSLLFDKDELTQMKKMRLHSQGPVYLVITYTVSTY